ncbi:MAG: YkgJ family cysteine cluster protein [Gallionella sp.]
MKWLRIGECKRCGRCCKADFLLKACNVWEKIILWFMLRSKGAKMDNLKGFTCPHLAEADGKHVCLTYEHRPEFCKKFPASPRDLIDEDCGFRFVDHDDDGFETARINVALECYRRNQPIMGTMYQDGSFKIGKDKV